MDPTKIEKLTKLKYPSNKKEVHQFLGLAGYFWDFMRDFAGISAPLTNLTKDENPETFELSPEEKIAVSTWKNRTSGVSHFTISRL